MWQGVTLYTPIPLDCCAIRACSCSTCASTGHTSMHQRLQQVLLQRLPQQAPDMLHHRACAQSSTGQQLRPERSWHISRPSLHPHPQCHSNFLPSKFVCWHHPLPQECAAPYASVTWTICTVCQPACLAAFLCSAAASPGSRPLLCYSTPALDQVLLSCCRTHTHLRQQAAAGHYG